MSVLPSPLPLWLFVSCQFLLNHNFCCQSNAGWLNILWPAAHDQSMPSARSSLLSLLLTDQRMERGKLSGDSGPQGDQREGWLTLHCQVTHIYYLQWTWTIEQRVLCASLTACFIKRHAHLSGRFKTFSMFEKRNRSGDWQIDTWLSVVDKSQFLTNQLWKVAVMCQFSTDLRLIYLPDILFLKKRFYISFLTIFS